MSFDWQAYLDVVSPGLPRRKGGDEIIASLCPSCGKTDNKISVRLDWGSYRCYRCGEKYTPHKVVIAYEGLSGMSLRARVAEFSRDAMRSKFNSLEEAISSLDEKASAPSDPEILPLSNPPMISPLSPLAIQYLKGRGFTHEIASHFRLSMCRSWPYEGRIFIPIEHKGELVSFQARAIGGNVSPRYLFPPRNRSHQVLYNLDNIEPGWAVLVEGVTDAWSVFLHATTNVVASFGKILTDYQKKLMASSRISELYIMMDQDARKEAVSLAASLYNIKKVRLAFLSEPGSDPASHPHLISNAMDAAEEYSPHKHLRLMLG